MKNKKKIIILVAETGADISLEDRNKYEIYSVPMHVTFGEQTLDDGTFPPEKVVQFYRTTRQQPKTSGSSPEDFRRVFDQIHQWYPEGQILYLAYSAVTTCSYQSACIAAEGRDYIKLVDTKSVSAGQNAIVTSMAEKLREHPEWGMKQALEEVERLIRDICMCFVPDNMDFLRAGGRVSNAVALCGDILGIHP